MDDCPNRRTHYGVAHGTVLMSGCEFHVRMWVRDCDHLAFFDAEFQEKIHKMYEESANATGRAGTVNLFPVILRSGDAQDVLANDE